MSSYIVFHPDTVRECVRVEGLAITDDSQGAAPWTGNIWVDARDGGNEDPWCLSRPWLYSYCHATELQRKSMGAGDTVFFISGDDADRNRFTCDTVFIIRQRHEWHGFVKFRWVPSGLPTGLVHHQQDGSEAWHRHLRFGLPQANGHSGRYTFEAVEFQESGDPYSFLPLLASGIRTTLGMDVIPPAVAEAIRGKRRGKHPFPLSPDDAKALYGSLLALSPIKVIRIMRECEPSNPTRTEDCGSRQPCR